MACDLVYFYFFLFFDYLTRIKIIVVVVVANLIYLHHICKRDRPQQYLIRLWKNVDH